MTLVLPGNIPIAGRSLAALKALGKPVKLPGFQLSKAFALMTGDESDPCIVFASPALRSYRAVWKAAHRADLVDDLNAWGEGVDVDHVYARSLAQASRTRMAYVRLFPVWAEVNRSAGAGREKAAMKDASHPALIKAILYADELQILKILGHLVGTESEPVSIFEIDCHSHLDS